MNIRQAYYNTLDKLNKLVSNNAQDIPYNIFIENLNEAQLHWVDNALKLAEKNLSEIKNLQKILVLGHEIKNPKKKELFYQFSLPDNYLQYSSSYTKINKCPFILENNLTEAANIIDFTKNSNEKSSLDFEEALIVLADDKIAIYQDDDFIPQKIVLNYYRFPRKANLKDGFSDFDGNENTDVDLEFSDDIVNNIIDLTVNK